MKKLIIKKHEDFKAYFYIHFTNTECRVKILKSDFYSKYSENYSTYSKSKSGDFLFLSQTYGLIYFSRLFYLKKLNKSNFDIANKDKLLQSIRSTDIHCDNDGEYLLKVHLQ